MTIEDLDIEAIWDGFKDHHGFLMPKWFNRFHEGDLFQFLQKHTPDALSQSILCDESLKIWINIGLIKERNSDLNFYEIID